MTTANLQSPTAHRTRDLFKGVFQIISDMRKHLEILQLKTEADMIFRGIQRDLDASKTGSISYTYADFSNMPQMDFLPLSPGSLYAPERLCCHYGAMITAVAQAHQKLTRADQIGRDIGLGGIAYAFLPHKIHPLYLFCTLCLTANSWLDEIQSYNAVTMTHKRQGS